MDDDMGMDEESTSSSGSDNDDDVPPPPPPPLFRDLPTFAPLRQPRKSPPLTYFGFYTDLHGLTSCLPFSCPAGGRSTCRRLVGLGHELGRGG